MVLLLHHSARDDVHVSFVARPRLHNPNTPRKLALAYTFRYSSGVVELNVP